MYTLIHHMKVSRDASISRYPPARDSIGHNWILCLAASWDTCAAWTLHITPFVWCIGRHCSRRPEFIYTRVSQTELMIRSRQQKRSDFYKKMHLPLKLETGWRLPTRMRICVPGFRDKTLVASGQWNPSKLL